MASARANLPCLVLSPLLLFSACEHSGPPDTEVLVGPLVDLHYSPEFEPCGGNVSAIDAFARFAAAVIGLEPDDLLHTRFYWLTDEDYESFLGEDCKDETSGCAGPRGAFSRLPIHHHELAHVVALNLSRDAPRFLSEGFAEATDPSSGWPLGELDPRKFLSVDGDAFDSDAYAAARRFVLYLLQRHGTGPFRDLYAGLPNDADLMAWDDAFRASYGASLDDVVEAYLATADCTPDIAPFPNFACQAPTLLAEEGAIHFEHTLECSDPEVEGGLRPDYLDQPLGRWGTWITRAIEIPTTGDYDIRVDLPAVESGLFNYARLQRCGGCAWLDEELLPLPSGTTERHTLAAGRYALTLFNFNPDGGQGSFTLTPAD